MQALYLARREALEEIIGTRLIDDEAKARGSIRRRWSRRKSRPRAGADRSRYHVLVSDEPGPRAGRDAAAGSRRRSSRCLIEQRMDAGARRLHRAR